MSNPNLVPTRYRLGDMVDANIFGVMEHLREASNPHGSFVRAFLPPRAHEAAEAHFALDRSSGRHLSQIIANEAAYFAAGAARRAVIGAPHVVYPQLPEFSFYDLTSLAEPMALAHGVDYLHRRPSLNALTDVFMATIDPTDHDALTARAIAGLAFYDIETFLIQQYNDTSHIDEAFDALMQNNFFGSPSD